jgi:hypothetical protein
MHLRGLRLVTLLQRRPQTTKMLFRLLTGGSSRGSTNPSDKYFLGLAFLFQICKKLRRAIKSLEILSKTLNLLLILNFF